MILHARYDLGVKPCGTRLGTRKGEKGAVRLPNILVLTGLSPRNNGKKSLIASLTESRALGRPVIAPHSCRGRRCSKASLAFALAFP